MQEKEFDKFIDEVETWASKADPNDIEKWELYASTYIKNWGWNEKAISDFIKWGKYGFNIRVLKQPCNIESFYNEVEYNSDRMNIDRLFRCHVKYRNISINEK